MTSSAARPERDTDMTVVQGGDSVGVAAPTPAPAHLMSLAQRQYASAIEQAQAALEEPLRPDDEILALYCLAVALHHAGRSEKSLDAATRCLDAATAHDSAGWMSNALTVRAQVLAATGEPETALDDLIQAEVVLENCLDQGLRNWAHAGLGTGYTSLRLYELALPHFELAPTIPEQPVDIDVGEAINISNLADLHLRWAAELERVGLDLDRFRVEHETHLGAARRWVAAGQALEVLEDNEVWATAFDRLRYQVDSSLDPDAVIDGLEEQAELDLRSGRFDDAILGKAHLCRAYRLLGRLDESVAAGREAVDLLTDESGMNTRLDAYHQLHEAQHTAEVPGASDVRGYILINAALLWQQRSRSVEGVRARRDLAVLEAQHAFSSRLAREDPLTGALNRRALDEWIEAHPHGPATLVMIDLDQFKHINDNFGHSVGDEVLVRVAKTLSRASRAGDLVARLGGDEFVIAIDGGITTTYELCRRIEGSIASTNVGDLAPGLFVRASIGAASVAVGQSTSELLSRADKDMFESKRAVTALSS